MLTQRQNQTYNLFTRNGSATVTTYYSPYAIEDMGAVLFQTQEAALEHAEANIMNVVSWESETLEPFDTSTLYTYHIGTDWLAYATHKIGLELDGALL